MKLRDQRLVQRIPSLGPVQSQLNNNAVLVLDGRESVEGVTGDKEGRGLRRRRGRRSTWRSWCESEETGMRTEEAESWDNRRS